jgi:hypothetical protein
MHWAVFRIVSFIILHLFYVTVAMNFDVDIDAILTAIAWPIFAGIVLILVIVNRKHLGPFIKGLRISKVSFGPVSIELAVTTGIKPNLVVDTASGSFDLRNETGIPVESSDKETIIEQIKHGSQKDFAIFDLGNGKDWLSSRLFLFTIVLQDLYELKSIVFVGMRNGIANHFLGVIKPRDVRHALAKKYPWLENNFGNAYVSKWQQKGYFGQTRNIFGSLDQANAIEVVINFLRVGG